MTGADRYLYELRPDGVIAGSRERRRRIGKIARTAHSGHVLEVEPDSFFNRTLARGYVRLAAGDEPECALFVSNPEPSTSPYQHVLGMLRGVLITEDGRVPFTESDRLETEFRPSSTLYRMEIRGHTVTLEASLYGSSGICAVARSDGGTLELSFGGCLFSGRTFSASYIARDARTIRSRVCGSDGDYVTEADDLSFDYGGRPPVTERCVIRFRGTNMRSSATDGTAVATAAGELAFSAVCIRGDLPAGDDGITDYAAAVAAIASERAYYDSLLGIAHAKTPSAVLDAGFSCNIAEHDRGYVENAWYEGVHWWNCYWTNNYQISAAVSLGQYERAARALRFFGGNESGYACTDASGRCIKKLYNHKCGRELRGYDGIPYYLYQLAQYTDATGDLSVFLDIYDNIRLTLADMELARFNAETGLYNFHTHCNAFMYQADHIGMPGSATAISLMMAGGFDSLAGLCETAGLGDDAAEYRRRAEALRANAVRYLWNSREGRFYSHLDYQNRLHSASYYTDYIFPALYSGLGGDYAAGPLKRVKSALMYVSPATGLPMLRVGDFMPSIFGNDNPMPTQQCEAARAFAGRGESGLACGMLEAAALASTIFTESPGSSPERFSDDGKGEANYLFGNPCGSFIHAFVAGLFGVRVCDLGKTLEIAPSFPAGWTGAEIALPYAGYSYRLNDGILTLDIQNGGGCESVLVTLRHCGCSTPEVAGGRLADMSVCGNGETAIRIGAAAGHVRLSLRTAGYPPEEAYTLGHDRSVAPEPFTAAASSFIDVPDNAGSAHVCSAWRTGDDFVIRLRADGFDGDLYRAGGCLFRTSRADGNTVHVCRISGGVSDTETGEITQPPYPSEVCMKVGAAAAAVALFYVPELASRLTGDTVGRIILAYADGGEAIVPLADGVNMSSVYKNSAEGTIRVALGNGTGEDKACVLALPCDRGRILDRITISLDTADAELALIAASYLPA